MNRYIPIGLVLAAIFIGIPDIVQAEDAPAIVPTACGAHADAVSQLAEKFHESLHSVSTTDAHTLLEVFTSPNGETWTILITVPNGPTCLVASGENWSDTAPGATRDGGQFPTPAPQGYIPPAAKDSFGLDIKYEGFGGIDGGSII